MNVYQYLSGIQKGLHAPKDLKNSFGNYNYRSCESILEALKPLLGDGALYMSDDVVEMGDRIYIRATVTLIGPDGSSVSVTGIAREAMAKKGMDDSQITGSSSSYARKYALSGLFAIDNNQDEDGQDNRNYTPATATPPAPAPAPQQVAPSAEVISKSLDYTESQITEYDRALADTEKSIETHGLESDSIKTAVGFITKGRTFNIYNCTIPEMMRFQEGVKKKYRKEAAADKNPFEKGAA